MWSSAGALLSKATLLAAVLSMSMVSPWLREHHAAAAADQSSQPGDETTKVEREASAIKPGADFSQVKLKSSESEVMFSFPILPPELLIKHKPGSLEIYQENNSPLNGRRALLMIHGGGGEFKTQMRWDRVLTAFDKDPVFRKTFKVFFLRYDSSDALGDEIEQAKTLIPKLAAEVGEPVTVLALSMGGNIIGGALADPAVSNAVDRALCMGTPFHGSPLFSADWYQYSLYKHKFGPVTRLIDTLDYKFYFGKHRNYQRDLKWDNLDEGIPNVGAFKGITKAGPSGDLTPERDAGQLLRQVNKTDINKGKIIAYAGYLLNADIISTTAKHKIETYALAPYRFLTVRMPAQLGREQSALKVLSTKIGKVQAVDEEGVSVRRFALNDGITPVPSALFLAPHAVRKYPILKESDLKHLIPHVDVRLGRVFRDIDHVTFVEGVPPHGGSKLMQDELHPEDGSHTIFEWMLDELLERNQGDRKDNELVAP